MIHGSKPMSQTGKPRLLETASKSSSALLRSQRSGSFRTLAVIAQVWLDLVLPESLALTEV